VNVTLAIPVWDERVSTTLDFARRLLVVGTDGGREVSRKEVTLAEEPFTRKARRIRDLGVEVVLCGAVSRALARAIIQTGVRIIPFVSGGVDEVLGGYLCGVLYEPRFMQPGCCPGARRRWRHRCGGRGQQR